MKRAKNKPKNEPVGYLKFVRPLLVGCGVGAAVCAVILMALALAMSIDSLVTGTMAALLDIPVAATLVLSFAVGVCMMYGGLWLGRKAASRFRCDLSWISGVLLMVLALMKVLH